MCCCTPQAYKDLLDVVGLMTVDDIQTSPDIPGESDDITKVQIGINLPPEYSLGFIDDEFLFAYTPNGEVYKFVKSTNPFDPDFTYLPFGNVKVTNENKGDWKFSIGIVPVLITPMTCTLPTLKLSADSNIEPTPAVTFNMVSVKRIQFSQNNGSNSTTITNFTLVISGVPVVVPGSFNVSTLNIFGQNAFKAALLAALNGAGFKTTNENVAWRQPGYINNGSDQEVAIISVGAAQNAGGIGVSVKQLTLDLFQGLDTQVNSVSDDQGAYTLQLGQLQTFEPVNAAFLNLSTGAGTPINLQLTSNQIVPGGNFDPFVNSPTVGANPIYSQLANARFTIVNDAVPSTYEYVYDGVVYPFSANSDAASVAAALLSVLVNDIPQGAQPNYLWDDEVDVTVFFTNRN